jgi:hypothetical protein
MTTPQSTPDPVAADRGVPALRIAGLTKSFGQTAAVSDVELTVTSRRAGPDPAGRPARAVPWLSWVAVPAGIASGAAKVAYLGERALNRLSDQQVRILRVLADAAR